MCLFGWFVCLLDWSLDRHTSRKGTFVFHVVFLFVQFVGVFPHASYPNIIYIYTCIYILYIYTNPSPYLCPGVGRSA